MYAGFKQIGGVTQFLFIILDGKPHDINVLMPLVFFTTSDVSAHESVEKAITTYTSLVKDP
jgi:hypothetical protein